MLKTSSYCRLVPSARDSEIKSIQRSTKDSNKYLKVVFINATTHAQQYYPVIIKWYNLKLRKKNKFVAKNILA